MRLLLQESVSGLGTIGDVVEVRPGYGRNYLIPEGIALAVTQDNLRQIAKRKEDMLKDEALRRGELEQIAKVLADRSVTIRARAAGDDGQLYGSVGAQAIADAFHGEGFPVEAKMVLMEEPIRQLGVFDVRIRLYPGVDVTAKAWVVDENDGAEQS